MSGIPRIPFVAIRAYAQQYGWSGQNDFDTFDFLVAAMDDEAVKTWGEMAPKAT